MLPIHIVDAFTSKRFAGNPAAVVVLDHWLDDDHLQSIAAENNLAETAFILRDSDVWQLRWFTPTVEVPLCGHATLASAWVIFNRLEPECQNIMFSTQKSGLLKVERKGELLAMDFPAMPPVPSKHDLETELGRAPQAVFSTNSAWLAVFEAADEIMKLAPDMPAVEALGPKFVIATAPGGKDYDCISRVFVPADGIPEDPVTGAAHCVLAPYWAERLGKTEIRAFQASSRGGEMTCRLRGERVELEGQCVPYLTGMIEGGR